MSSHYITLAQLRKHGACQDQCAQFERRFGERVRVSRKLCVSVAHVFDWDWAAACLCSPPARRAYEQATAPASPAGRAYEAAMAAAWRVYEAAIAPAQRAYEKAMAAAFADAYNSPENQS